MAIVARDGVEGPTGRVDHDGIKDVGTTARRFELDRGSFVGAGWLNKSCTCTQGSRRRKYPAMIACVGGLASRYLPVRDVD